MLLVTLLFVKQCYWSPSRSCCCTLQVSPAYLMSIVVMVNEKKRERMPAWEVGQTDSCLAYWL